ncbi:hypothetical protein JQX13_21545 [Archangium violaceum]|uniref:hypothetical protein n=1 Tax=Archangium violaceum TaxID=83451 RepID=UPI00193B0873|nr:hypothetical protein [Archangium violaceum]QRK12378.1 hypothetical protein JQX13_21545 [Archangium violaceum]
MRMRCLLAVGMFGVLGLGCHVTAAEAGAWEDDSQREQRDAMLPLTTRGTGNCTSLLPGPLGAPTGTLDVFDPDESVTVRVDGAGNLLFAFHNVVTESFRLELRRMDGSLVTSIFSLPPQHFLIDQSEGFHLLGPRSRTDPTVVLHVLTAAGTLIPKPLTFTGLLDAVPRDGNGTLISRSLKFSSTRWRVEAFVLDADGELSAGPIFIENGTGASPPPARIGSSDPESALILFDSSELQDGTRWSARWLKPSEGLAVGMPFEVAANLTSSPSPRLIPLLDGELGLRAGEVWLGRFRPFQKQLLLAAPWLAVQPGYEVAPIGTGRGYGLFSPGGDFACMNFLVVRTPTGEVCGEVVLPTPPPPCQESSIRVTRVGTLLQFAPFFSEPGSRIRWWSGLLD